MSVLCLFRARVIVTAGMHELWSRYNSRRDSQLLYRVSTILIVRPFNTTYHEAKKVHILETIIKKSTHNYYLKKIYRNRLTRQLWKIN